MVGLPRSIVKKYGISKKAWRIFKSRKSMKKKRNVSPKTLRKRRVRVVPRKRTYRRRRRGTSWKTLLRNFSAGAGVGTVLGMVADLTGFQVAKSPLVNVMAGWYLGGMAGAVGSLMASGGLGALGLNQSQGTIRVYQ